MTLPRRSFLKGILATGGAMALGTSILPETVMAKEWPQNAFEAENVKDVLLKLFKTVTPKESNQIIIDAPDIAENGAVVPIEVTTKLPKVESITILGEKNPTPLVAHFNFANNADAWIKTRIKLGETSNIIAIVKVDGRFYMAHRAVKVTIGGCGG